MFEDSAKQPEATSSLDSRASVLWVKSRLSSFETGIDQWIFNNVTIEIEYSPEDPNHDILIAQEVDQIPLEFNIELGAYLNILRSSLDILATDLARRYLESFDESKIHFPIVKKEAEFCKKGTISHKFLENMPASIVDKFRSFSPWKEGNPKLWTLHTLDNMRKHRRLLLVDTGLRSFQLEGSDVGKHFMPLLTGPMRTGYRTVLGSWARGYPLPKLSFSGYAKFVEEGHTRRPVAVVIGELADEALRVIDAFD